MRRTIIVEIDDKSAAMQRKPEKTLKWMLGIIADQLYWGDTARAIQDRDGNVVGQWRLTDG